MERLLSIDELSKLLGVTKAAIYSWTCRKKIPYVKLGRKLLKFREDEIMKWIEERSVPLHEDKVSDKNQPRNSKHIKSSHEKDSAIERIIENAKKSLRQAS